MMENTNTKKDNAAEPTKLPAEPETQTASAVEDMLITSPVTDIIEQPDQVKLVMEVPGVAAEQIKIDVEENLLKIVADSPFERGGRKVRYQRSFQLSDVFDTERISAACRHGLLTLSIPRLKSTQPRKIKVEVK
ncbi:MAG: Hsp20/alpha crystallin family protein [Victivallaceae bacterium]|nr:Hsp20/alpha crystallin family protein [Victivallaceae bacterium]